jgi:predicted deacylase
VETALAKPDAPLAPPAPAATWSQIGASKQQRALEAMTLGHGPGRIYLIGGIHGDETEGQAVLPRLIEAVGQKPQAAHVTVRIVRDANPDGAAEHTRGNADGRDLNRNWPAANFTPRGANGPRPLSEPETQAIARDMNAFAPDLVVVFHSTPRGPFVNYDGPAQSYAEVFVAAAKEIDPRWRVVPQMGYPTPGSLGSYVGVDRGLPILTIEFKRGETGEATEAALRGLAAIVSGYSRVDSR